MGRRPRSFDEDRRVIKRPRRAAMEARDRVGTLDADGQAAYASKCGAGIFAGPCSRFDALYTLGMCSRCLTFPTERMMKRRLPISRRLSREGK